MRSAREPGNRGQSLRFSHFGATAAKEIRQIIARSGEQVTSGLRLVTGTDEALHGIITQVSQLDTHVGAMVEAAREQALGLREIRQAVNAIDQTTQHNAAMVESTNAATHTLINEAAALTALIEDFRLRDETGQRHRTAAAIRPAA